MEDKQANHTHKGRKAGRGGKEKKKDRLAKDKGTQVERHNSRAFSVSKIGRTKRSIQRNLDRAQRKEYVPLTDRRPEAHATTALAAAAAATAASSGIASAPPSVIVVVGPPRVGKSTLIRSLVKLYTNHNLTNVVGPITIVTGKNNARRITIFECPSDDTAALLDCAKIADMVLLCVDAKFGFELDTFECLNVLQTHGFPKVAAVLTHLDQFRTSKNLRRTKKLLKHRFWTDIYDGAKIFYLSGVIHGKYLKNEIKQLALYLSRVKVRFFSIICFRLHSV
jgi:ribosome biogenesis protein BMS1